MKTESDFYMSDYVSFYMSDYVSFYMSDYVRLNLLNNFVKIYKCSGGSRISVEGVVSLNEPPEQYLDLH